jgi:tripartite ATP-independent transporter DctP family solute receptor
MWEVIMERREERILTVILTVLTFLVPSIVFAQPSGQAKYVIRAGYTNPVAHPVTETGYLFQELVHSRSKGQIKVEVYPSAQLGSNKELAESVRAGTVQMTALAPEYMTPLVPWFDSLSLPFLWDSYTTEWASFNGWLGKKMTAALEEKGVSTIAINEAGFSHFGNRVRPIEKVEDLKGLKIRVIPSPILLAALQALGAKPIAMDYKELYTSLESGAIDGVLLPATYIWNSKFHEVINYYSLCGFFHFPMVTYMNKKFLDSLPPDLKIIVLDSAKIAQDRQRAKVAGEEVEILEILGTKTKLKINTISAEQLKQFRAAVKPVYEIARKKFGKDLVDKLEPNSMR